VTLNPKCQGLIANQMRKQSPSRGHLKSSPSPSACFRSPADRLNHALGAPGLLAFACCASSYPCHHMSKRTRKIPAPASSFTCHTPLPCCGVCVHAQPRPPHLAFQQPVFQFIDEFPPPIEPVRIPNPKPQACPGQRC